MCCLMLLLVPTSMSTGFGDEKCPLTLPVLNEIDPHFYLGSIEGRPLAAAHLNISLVISVVPPPTTTTVIYAAFPAPATETRFHFDDNYDVPKKTLHAVLDVTDRLIIDALAASKNVFVHCMAGISRSGMIATSALMRHRGMSAAEALRYIQRARPQVQPNSLFMDVLQER